MKKLLLLLLIAPFIFISCSSDDEDDVELTKDLIIGTWNVTEYNGETIPANAAYIELESDGSYFVKFLTNTYIGEYEIKGNTVIGTTLDPITEYYKFDNLQGGKATISYSNSDGDKYTIKAEKK